VSTSNPVSYSDILERNIFDTRYTGSGKTTSALNYIAEVVKKNRPVIVLMQSYERLETNYHRYLDKIRSIVFKGKTQDGMCIHSGIYKKMRSEGKTPKDECEKCPDSETCAYQKQLKQLASFKQSTEGFCILTTEKNLNNMAVSEVMALLNPVLIIDDISLSTVVMPELEVTSYKLKSLVDHLRAHGVKAQHLHDLSLLLRDFSDENETKIISYISGNEDQLKKELVLFQTDHEGKEKLPSHCALPFLSSLIYAVKKSDSLHFYSEYDELKVVADESSKFNSLKVIYLNATPSLKDEYCIKQLGDFKRLTAKVEETKRYAIFQIIDSATTKQAILTSARMKSDVQELTKVIKPTLGVIGQKLLVFGHDEVLKDWDKQDVFSGVELSSEKYFGDGTRGTNDYRDYPISFVLGTPYYRPDYFLHPAFEEHWKSKKEIDSERKKDPMWFYYVNRDISVPEAKINLLQMIGRNLRESSDNPDAVKVVVVFTDLDIAKECKEQNGGIVFRCNIRREIPIVQGTKKGKTPVFDNYKKASQAALKPKIKRSIEEHIDKLIEANPSPPLILQRVAEGLQDRIKIYNTEGIKKLIREIYDTETMSVLNKGKMVKTAFISQKKPE
jgi:hypothetical protein